MTNAETDDRAATVAPQGATVAPEKASSKKVAKRAKSAPKSQKITIGAKGRKGKDGKRTARGGRVPSKGAQILEMIGRAKGATLAEIMSAIGWQAHCARVHLHGGQEARGENRIPEERVWRPGLPDYQVNHRHLPTTAAGSTIRRRFCVRGERRY